MTAPVPERKPGQTRSPDRDSVSTLVDAWCRKWLLGVAAAVALAALGVRCIVSRHGWLPGTDWATTGFGAGWLELNGAAAVMLGVVWLGAAMALHGHYFWEGHPRWSGVGELLMIGGLLALIGGLGYISFHVFFEGVF